MSAPNSFKVLVVSPLGYTGIAYYDYSLCQTLCDQGVDVELCTSDKWILAKHKNKFKISYLYKHCSGNINRIVKGFYYFVSSIHIVYYAIKNKKNIIHFQVVELPAIDFFAMLILRLCGKHVVYTPHDVIHNKDLPFKKIWTALLYQIANCIVLHQSANRTELLKLFHMNPSKITIIPQGNYEIFVDKNVSKLRARKELGLDEKQKVILFFGNIQPNKGVEILLKAIALVRDDVDNLIVVIAGRPRGGITKEWLLSLIENENIGDHMFIKCEFIPDHEIVFYYASSDIVVLPYTEISGSAVLRFAQSYGKPVICSNLQEFRETVLDGETGYLFNVGDYNELAQQISVAFSNEQLEKVGKNAREMMEKRYSWGRIALQTSSLYKDVMNSRVKKESRGI